MTPKGDQATFGVGGLRGGLRGISTSSDEHLISPNLSEEVVRVCIVPVAVIDTNDARFDTMEVGEVRKSFFSLRDKVGKGGFRVIHLHSLPGIPGGDTESDSVFTNGACDGFDDFEWEPGAILDRSTVFVCPLVRDVLEELVREVSVGEMKFDSVESGLVDGFVGGLGMPLNVGFNLFDCQWTRGRVGRGDGDIGRADQFKVGVLGLEQFRVCSAAEGPKLKEDV